MYKLLRYYNQNRYKIWSVIITVIIILSVIKILNFYLKNKKQDNKEDKETTSNVVSYDNESKSMVTEKSVPEKYREDFGKFINQFLTYCTEHDPQTAYSMLSSDTKQELYQTETLFEKNYYESKFLGDKQFSFQSWSTSDDYYVYMVKIFDNMLATGQTSDNYIEDYITLKVENGEYKINLNGYLGKEMINKNAENDSIGVEIIKVDKYLDYQIYTINIQNKTNRNVMMDTRRKTNSCYVMDKKENKFSALLYENKDEDLSLKPKEVKTIRIKFSVANRENLEIKSINFTDIVDSDEYSKNANIEGKTFTVDI